MEKVKKILIILLLVFLPSQLGLHLWPDWSLANGVRVDYFSPTFYFTDFLIMGLLLLEFKKFGSKALKFWWLTPFVVLNICFSLQPEVSLYKWLKVAELGFLIWFVARERINLKWLLIPVSYVSLLAIWQFINQSSVGGLWWWLGERTFNGGTPGIANAEIFGQLVLRPYSVFSHPNVLAGWLIVVIVLLLPHISRKITAVVLVLALGALLLTFSRLAGSGFVRTEADSFTVRGLYNSVAIKQWVSSPLIGTGLGTSPLYPIKIANFALTNQPIHNIYLLLLSETGLIGLLFFLVLIFKRLNWPLVAILILGLFDHYFLTLQQGQLLLVFVLGLSLSPLDRLLSKH